MPVGSTLCQPKNKVTAPATRTPPPPGSHYWWQAGCVRLPPTRALTVHLLLLASLQQNVLSTRQDPVLCILRQMPRVPCFAHEQQVCPHYLHLWLSSKERHPCHPVTGAGGEPTFQHEPVSVHTVPGSLQLGPHTSLETETKARRSHVSHTGTTQRPPKFSEAQGQKDRKCRAAGLQPCPGAPPPTVLNPLLHAPEPGEPQKDEEWYQYGENNRRAWGSRRD